ncbi:hypothetical protein Syun_010001 [Stephania yunnanensis]|uniref:Uncharacterized protein n=1 Tax=Stephania yunnanensis TaxID=152371 RepID=A0AAP0E6Q5_9MAGN
MSKRRLSGLFLRIKPSKDLDWSSHHMGQLPQSSHNHYILGSGRAFLLVEIFA